MRDQTISDFLDQLADRVPAPGGGASAALHGAQAAALLGMVARYSDGPQHAEHRQVIARILKEADTLREHTLQLAEDDAVAFTSVSNAYRLPKATEEERAIRSAAIAEALVAAAGPPARTIDAARRLIGLAEQLLPIGNRNVITDVAAAAEAARAAATTARVNVEINLVGIGDERIRAELAGQAAGVDELATRAEKVTAAVREEIAK